MMISPSNRVVTGIGSADRTAAVSVREVSWTPSRLFRVPLLIVAAIAGLGAAGLTALVVAHPFMEWDAGIERAVQAFNWGPLAATFPIFSWIGDIKGAGIDAALLVLILLFNRPAWRLAVAGAATGVPYTVIAHIVLRPRPNVGQVLQVLEHPGASSFPSGHTIFIVTICTLLVLCLGYRFLPRRAMPIVWTIAALIVFAGAVSRIYVGAHWPTDVFAGFLIAVAWLALVVSIRPISDRVFVR